MTDTNNAYIGDTVLFLILFFSTAAATFLLNLRYAHTYSYLQTTSTLDLIAVLLIISVWNWYITLGLAAILAAQALRTPQVAN